MGQLAHTGWTAHPIPRLSPLLQAYAAEIRYWQAVVTPGSELHWQLGQLIRMLGAIRNDANVKEFIRGLSLNHQDDWLCLSRDGYARVAKFDRDAELPLDKKPPSGRDLKPEKEARNFTWPALPRIRALVKHKPLVFIGGLPVPNKIASVAERFGFEVEWLEVYRDTGAQTAITRVRTNNIGAVILLEKFLGHTTSNTIVAACRELGIPWAFGGNAGIATLERAFDQIESKSAA